MSRDRTRFGSLAVIALAIVGCSAPPVSGPPSGGDSAARSSGGKKEKHEPAGDDDDDDDSEPTKLKSSAQTAGPAPAAAGAPCGGTSGLACKSGLVCGQASGVCEPPAGAAPTSPGPTAQATATAPASTGECLQLSMCCGRLTDLVDRLACTATASAGKDSACAVTLFVCMAGGIGIGGVFQGGSSSGEPPQG